MTTVTIEAPPDVRAAWRRVRLPLLVVAVLLLSAVIIAAVQNAPPRQPLDPRDASHQGGRALAQLIRDRGVTVASVASTIGQAVDADATVFIPDPAALSRSELHALRASPADIVVIEPTARELAALGLGARVTGADRFGSTPAPQCALDEAMVAGDVRYQGTAYLAPSTATACYPVAGAAGLVVAQRDTARTVVFGSPTTWSNDQLADEGDAALALSLLTARPHLIWVLPKPPTQAAADRPRHGLVQLLPPGVLWATLQLAVAVALLALWRARRLGPVVPEPLPVIVRATETVEGRARLLRAARARDTAASALRAASVARLQDVLGLGADAPSAAVVAAAARESGWQGSDIERLLYGAIPHDDVSLLQLGRSLDALERSVRQP